LLDARFRGHDKRQFGLIARFSGVAERLPLRQPPQIERGIGGFFRRYRLGRADDPLGGRRVAGAVDRDSTPASLPSRNSRATLARGRALSATTPSPPPTAA
jgi:hypothetical protein